MIVGGGGVLLGFSRLPFPCPQFVEFTGLKVRGYEPASQADRASGEHPACEANPEDNPTAIGLKGCMVKIVALADGTLSWSHRSLPRVEVDDET